MIQSGFSFNLNKCTGCNACQIACSIENQVEIPMNWRQVNTFNESRYPDLPYFHITIACNHCADPPCMEYCPALAYFKDEYTGSVLIDQDKCIGCHYCSWVCPFDAPTYNPANNIMEKCTFCSHRLEENLDPACVSVCPTGALQHSQVDTDNLVPSVPGFPKTEIKPAIHLIPLRENHILPEKTNMPFDEQTVQRFIESLLQTRMREKLSCAAEWPLVIFALLNALLTGLISGVMLGKIHIDPGYLLLSGVFGIFVSSIHLGKKFRAARAILNWRKSWLSREILSFGLFLLSITLIVLFPVILSWMGWIAILFGFLTLYSLDKIYEVLPLKNSSIHFSSNAVLTGLFLSTLFTQFYSGVIIFGLIKLGLYLSKRFFSVRNNPVSSIIISCLRIILGFIVPLIIWIQEPFGNFIIILGFVLVGELIDRCQFYNKLSIITPQKQMLEDFKTKMSKN